MAFIVGETSRAGSRSRSRPSAKAAGQLDGKAETSAKPSSTEWKFRWSADGPGPLLAGDGSEPDLTLTLSPDDAELVRSGQLDPSVAFMQGKLKTVGRQCPLVTCAFLDHYPGIRGGVGCLVNGPLR